MSEDLNKEVENVNEGEELDNIIILNDEDGNEVEFEFLDLIEYEGEEYVDISFTQRACLHIFKRRKNI